MDVITERQISTKWCDVIGASQNFSTIVKWILTWCTEANYFIPENDGKSANIVFKAKAMGIDIEIKELSKSNNGKITVRLHYKYATYIYDFTSAEEMDHVYKKFREMWNKMIDDIEGGVADV